VPENDLQKRGTRDPKVLVDRALSWLLEASPRLSCSRPSSVPDYAAGAGAANETILVDVSVVLEDGHELEGLVLRVADPATAAFLDVDLQVQANVMDAVRRSGIAVPVPRVLAVDGTGEALGVPVMIMERLPGRVPSDFPGYNREGFLHDLPTSERRRLWQSAMDAMIAIHNAPESHVEHVVGPPRDLDELMDYWFSSLDWVESRRHDAVRPLRRTRDWLRSERPSHDPGLSWGDARMGNMLFKDTACTGVLDWEMFSRGGPLTDLAWWLMFDVNHSTDLGVDRLEGLGRRQETISYWEQGTGLSAAGLRWHEVFSLFRLSVIRLSIFQHRAAQGHRPPEPENPRSAERLIARIDALLATDGVS
jgi:aminoglycoside phosphotransferase (APT) family kinase protein